MAYLRYQDACYNFPNLITPFLWFIIIIWDFGFKVTILYKIYISPM